MTAVGKHPDLDDHVAGRWSLRKNLLVMIALAVVVLVVTLHLTGLIGAD